MPEKRLAVALLLLGGCATQPPPPAFFTCSGVAIEAASENLQRSGYITAWREGEEAIETTWTRHTVLDDEPRTLFLRHVVAAEDEGVRFTIEERKPDGEARWDRRSDLLEKLRQDVCGPGTTTSTASG